MKNLLYNLAALTGKQIAVLIVDGHKLCLLYLRKAVCRLMASNIYYTRRITNGKYHCCYLGL